MKYKEKIAELKEKNNANDSEIHKMISDLGRYCFVNKFKYKDERLKLSYTKEPKNSQENTEEKEDKAIEDEKELLEDKEIKDTKNTERSEDWDEVLKSEIGDENSDINLEKKIQNFNDEMNLLIKEELDLKAEIKTIDELESNVKILTKEIENSENLIKNIDKEMESDLTLLGDYIYKNSSLIVREEEKANFILISDLDEMHKNLISFEKQKEELAQASMGSLFSFLKNFKIHILKSKIKKILNNIPNVQKKIGTQMFDEVIKNINQSDTDEVFIKALFAQNEKKNKENELLLDFKNQLNSSKEKLKEFCGLSPSSMVKNKKTKMLSELLKKQNLLEHEFGTFILKNNFDYDDEIFRITKNIDNIKVNIESNKSLICKLEDAIKAESLQKDIDKRKMHIIEIDKLIRKKQEEKRNLEKEIESKSNQLENLRQKIGDLENLI